MSVEPEHDYGSVHSMSRSPYIRDTSTSLTISDIERLAKAGVSVTLSSIIPLADPFPPYAPVPTVRSLEDAIWDRWQRTRLATHSFHDTYGEVRPYQLLASTHGDKVWVSVHPTNFNYEPFQLQDDSAIFPSDALMANLALWEQHHK
jgi:hypothetical protein